MSKKHKTLNVRHLRRSSTARNLGGQQALDTPGIETEEDDEDDDDQDEQFVRRARLRRQNSIGGWKSNEKQDMDDALADYVTDKLARVRTSDSANADDVLNELEVEESHAESSQLDGHNDYFGRKPNGNRQYNGHS